MIKAELAFEGGLLKSCRIAGHAGAGPKGGDIVCAAVSVLSRTACKVLSERNGVMVDFEAPKPGEFRMEAALNEKSQKNMDFLDGVGTFLRDGLLSISGEFSGFCQVKIKER